MLCYYIDEYEPKQTNIDFESAREFLMKEDGQLAVKRRFERIRKMIEITSNTKYEEIPEYNEIYVLGFEQIKTDKIDKYILVGCTSVEKNKNKKLINFWSNKFIIKEI